MATEDPSSPAGKPNAATLSAEALAELELLAKTAERARQNLEKNIEIATKELELSKLAASVTGDITSEKEAQLQLNKLKLEQEAAILLKEKEIKELSEGELKRLKEIVQKTKELELTLNQIGLAKAQGSKLASLLGIDENNKNSLTYQLFSNPKATLQGFTDKVKDSGGIIQAYSAKIISSIEQQTIKAFFAYDSAAASIAKVAGSNAQLQGVLSETARGATQYGISFEQAGKAIEGLYTELNTFSTLSKEAQKEITVSTAKLDRLGISSQQSAKTIGSLTQIMGMTETQAAKTNEKLAGLALAIGKSPQQMASDFAGASDRLGAYGKDMVEVFSNLEVQSKATGVAVSDLVRIAEKFQTFEGAATSAGKLNAALGGGFINAMELLEASSEDPSKAIDLLRTRLDQAGLSFDKMSFYEKKLIAESAGFKSVEEASRILSMSNAQAEKAAKIAADRADKQKLVDEAVQRSIPIQQKLEMLMANFAVTMEKPVEIISSFITLITWLIDNIPGLNYVLGALIGSFILLQIVVSIKAMFMALAGAFGFFNTAAATTAPAVAGLAGSVEALAAAGTAAAPGLGTLAGSLGAVVVELAVLGIIIVAIIASVALLVYSIASLVGKFVELFKIIANTSDLVPRLAGLIAVMSAFSNPLTLIGMTQFAAGIAMIATELRKIPENTIVNFATVTDHVAKLATVEKGSTSFGKQTKDMIEAINNFKLDNAQVNNLSKILEKINPQQPQQPTNNQLPPITIKVLLDGKEVLARLDTTTANGR